MPVRGRVLLTPHRTGAWNMAFDSALLARASANEISLRVYGWRPETLSLGALEPFDSVPQESRDRVPIVRRPTSGGLLFHNADEISFSLSGKGDSSPPADEIECTCLKAFRSALNELTENPRSVEDHLVVCQKRDSDGWLLQGFFAPSGREKLDTLLTHVPRQSQPPSELEVSTRQTRIQEILTTLGHSLGLEWSNDRGEPGDEETLLANRLLAKQFASFSWLRRR